MYIYIPTRLNMLYNVKIPPQFSIIKYNEHVIEFKSKYHYWRLSQGNNILILAHKYHKNDSFHKQFTCYNPTKAFKYIIQHDKYVESKITVQYSSKILF